MGQPVSRWRTDDSADPSAPPPQEAATAPVAEIREAKELRSAQQKSAKPDGVSPRERKISQHWIENTGACLSSMIVHLIVLLALGLWMVPGIAPALLPSLVVSSPTLEEEEEITVVLDERVNPATDTASALATAAVNEGVAAGLASTAIKAPEIDKEVTEKAEGPQIELIDPLAGIPSTKRLVSMAPVGTKGDPRAIVDDYDQAMDRITQEILLMLSESRVLVVWCFDQSESMRDDQEEIRDRIERVYVELGLHDAAAGDALTTSVVSFGEGFRLHTERPTFDVAVIRRAIDAVPEDDSGKEMMCQAVGQAIAINQKYAERTRRRMALILVTDESGDRDNNSAYLEPAIREAQSARCKIYTLGREAVFGYPFAHFRWQHPQTKRWHWLPVDRGPETAFVEQLQTGGFRRRYDAHASGFGPYEQTRLALETGGIFFMLPSVESSLVRGEKRRYELDAMRAYRPSLDDRDTIVALRSQSVLRSTLWKVINDLNPYQNKQIEMRVHFSRELPTFLRQVQEEKIKAKVYVNYLDRAETALKSIEHLRIRETPRWQANYDLMYAQLLAYKVRIFEYGAYLEWFGKNPVVVPLKKPPNLTLVHWDITTRKETLTGERTASYIEEATRLFQKIQEEHPGTPWAARADWELKRGYGVKLVPDYDPPYPDFQGKPIPIPKL
jgi:hypothetical protein